MALNQFVNNFVESENEIYDYTKKEKKGLRKRLHESMSDFIHSREKQLYDQIHYLKRKNRRIEEDYEILSNIAVTSIQKTIDNTVNDTTKSDSDNELEDLEHIKYDYYHGYKIVAWSFIRMCFIIYIGLFVVYFYDLVLSKSKVIALHNN